MYTNFLSVNLACFSAGKVVIATGVPAPVSEMEILLID